MRKKRFIFPIIIVLIISGTYLGLQIKYNKLEVSLKEHLINVEGYSESDIVSIKAKLSKMPQFPVYVEFTDDPGTIYVFTDRQANDWTQLSPESPQRLKEND